MSGCRSAHDTPTAHRNIIDATSTAAKSTTGAAEVVVPPYVERWLAQVAWKRDLVLRWYRLPATVRTSVVVTVDHLTPGDVLARADERPELLDELEALITQAERLSAGIMSDLGPYCDDLATGRLQ